MITDGPQPKHAQLREILERRVAGELKPGDPLPGERALEEEFGVSRITVRRAIGDLVAAGKLTRVRGKGTFVAPPPLVGGIHLASLSDEMRGHEVEASARVLEAAVEPAPPAAAAFFGTAGPHIHLRRLRLGGGEPYGVDDAWYNAALAPGLLERDLEHSVYRVLEEAYGVVVAQAEQTVAALAASPEEAELLLVEPGAPLLQVVRLASTSSTASTAGTSSTSSTPAAAPVEYCTSLYRTDRYRLRGRVSREAG